MHFAHFFIFKCINISGVYLSFISVETAIRSYEERKHYLIKESQNHNNIIKIPIVIIEL